MSEWLMGLKICAQDGATDDDVGVAMPQMDMLKERWSYRAGENPSFQPPTL